MMWNNQQLPPGHWPSQPKPRQTLNYGIPVSLPPNPATWNPQMLINIPTSSIDWAQLARQWIAHRDGPIIHPSQQPPTRIPKHMREFLNRPPPPHLGNNNSSILRPPPPPNMTTTHDIRYHIPMHNLNQSTRYPLNSHQHHHHHDSNNQEYQNVRLPLLENPNLNKKEIRNEIDLKQTSFSNDSFRDQTFLPFDDNGIDQNRRKNLPSWIREGLEKMEREKQKQLEKEKQAKEAQESRLSIKKMLDEDFTSNNELDDSSKELSDMEQSPKLENNFQDVPSESEIVNEIITAESIIETLSVEEKENISLKITRTILTELLLNVTNEKFFEICQHVYDSKKVNQAPAIQLAKSNALASIGSLGLGYDSEEDLEDKNSQASTEEDELFKRGNKKLEEFIENLENPAEKRKFFLDVKPANDLKSKSYQKKIEKSPEKRENSALKYSEKFIKRSRSKSKDSKSRSSRHSRSRSNSGRGHRRSRTRSHDKRHRHNRRSSSGSSTNSSLRNRRQRRDSNKNKKRKRRYSSSSSR